MKYRAEWKVKTEDEHKVFEVDDGFAFDDFICETLLEDHCVDDLDYLFIYCADAPRGKK